MSKPFTNPPTQNKDSKTFKGGVVIDPVKLEEVITDFKKLDENFDRVNRNFEDFKENINEFKKDTKDTVNTQNSWIIGGFIVLLFVVIGLLVAVYSMANDYFLMKQNSYQSLLDKINSLQKVQ